MVMKTPKRLHVDVLLKLILDEALTHRWDVVGRRLFSLLRLYLLRRLVAVRISKISSAIATIGTAFPGSCNATAPATLARILHQVLLLVVVGVALVVALVDVVTRLSPLFV